VKVSRSVLAVTVFFLVSFIFLTGSLGFAQEATPKIQVFAGYSFLHADVGGLTPVYLETTVHAPFSSFNVTRNFTNGWSAEAQYNLNRWVGIAADVNGRYGSPFTGMLSVSGTPNGHAYTFLAGPVISYRNKSRVTPFVHGLFGWDRASLSASTITGVPTPITVAATTYSDFTMALGGGADFRVTHHVSLRLGQLDWFHTSLNLSKFYTSAFPGDLFQGLSTNQRNWRASAGVVLRF